MKPMMPTGLSFQHPLLTTPAAQDGSPLASLQVFDALKVGPCTLTTKRLTVPYCLEFDGREEHTELIIRYEEDVFDPDDALSHNLASLLGAQVALNYGLFCKKVVFVGVFDQRDQRLLVEMMENTAREIYVKRLLADNPFVRKESLVIPHVQAERYNHARIEFVSTRTEGQTLAWRWWPTGEERHAVLSSGGKDSLLSFGLLRELGCEVHPLYVNESGRHWFTALNAYRHFAEHVPLTARVWTNADRVFTWFLRQMPFIRENFANLRADVYPIRLWTVGVFLFSVLPLMRKRGIGHLLIGNEYDTTCKTSTDGIEHYDGYFDQSRFFDEALSRYFLQKGWGVRVYSILRPLSELLIETILAKRYPELLRLQVSCHASHKAKDAEHFLPCGKCEKCRRIIAMLEAIESEPALCGYTPEQVQRALADLPEKVLNQEPASFAHLMWMLGQRQEAQTEAASAVHRPSHAKDDVGLSTPAHAQHEVDVHHGPHPEILKLRFHPDISPPTDIPVELRAPLYRLLLEHATGTVVHSPEGWEEISPTHPVLLEAPYAFGVAQETPSPRQRWLTSSQDTVTWGALTSPQAQRRLATTQVAILPVGAIEQHGPHLPLDTDAFDAHKLALAVAEACSEPRPLVLPPLPYGVSYHHDDFPGTLSLRNEVLSSLIYDLGVSVARNGIKKLLLLNGHGGNHATLNYAAQMLNRDVGLFVCVDSGETSDVDLYEHIETSNDVHAGELETSTSLAIRPHLVHMQQANPAVPHFASRYLNFTAKRGISWHVPTQVISHDGVLGDPTRANAQKGRILWSIMLAHLVALLEDLKHLQLDEFAQPQEGTLR